MTLREFPDVEQGSDEWTDLRRGLLTASTIGRLITVGAPEASAAACDECEQPIGAPCISRSRKTPTPIKTFHDGRVKAATGLPPVYSVADNETSRALIETLAGERIAGWSEESPMNRDMWRGVMCEPVARNAYRQEHAPVAQSGFMIRSEDGWELGYSPDGLVGDDGLIEIKAPRTKGHVRAVLEDEVPAHNMAQLEAGLFVSGRKWIDYIPFVGGLPLYVKRVYPDPAWFEVIRAAVVSCERQVSDIISRYQRATNGLPDTERVTDLYDPVVV